MHRRAASLLLSLMLLLVATPLAAEQQRVLTLLAMRREAPGSIVLDQVIRGELTRQMGGALDYYSEHLDVGRFSDQEYLTALRDFLKRKYAEHPFDLIVAPTNAAADFVRDHRDELFPGVPVVFSTGPGGGVGANATGVTHTLDLAATVEMALQLQPQLRQVYILSGAATTDKYYVSIVRDQLRGWESRLSIVYWSDLTFGDALRRVGQLPAAAVLYALPFTADSSGQRFNAVPTLEAVTAAANVPVYHFADVAIGHGVVGGGLASTEVLGRGLAAVALRVLRGERPDDIPIVSLDILRHEVDWRQLQRWGISEARLPEGTIIHFREPGVWERYQHYIAGVMALVLLQTALIAGLLIERRTRRRVEDSLRISYRENQGLAGRLIVAQEAERTRIARDLHDDASQELASLAMSMSLLKVRLGTGADGDIADSLNELQQRTVALGEDLRTLSHELHPGVLQHVGIVAALRSHRADFERRQEIRTTFEATGDFADLDMDTSLCLFRVAQEALTNAARHSRAESVVVNLARVAGRVQLLVSDNGVGFALSQRTSGGLGLRSIDERVKLISGTATVTSAPGQGTAVFVSIPVADVADGQAADVC